MGRLAENLEALCREEPSKARNVIITLSEAAREMKASELGLDTAQEIPGLSGIFKGSLPGEKILDLIQRQQVEEITEDFEVDIHAN